MELAYALDVEGLVGALRDGIVEQVPVAVECYGTPRVDHRDVSGRQLADARQQRARPRHAEERQVVRQAHLVHRRADPRMRDQPARRGRERQVAGPRAVVERVHAEAVPPQHQPAAVAVPERERELAVGPTEPMSTFRREEVEKQLAGVAAAGRVALAPQPRRHLEVVEDLPVAHHRERAVLAGVHDGPRVRAPCPDAHHQLAVPIDEHRRGALPARAERAEHPRERLGGAVLPGAWAEESADRRHAGQWDPRASSYRS